ncbi:MAG: 7-cyano-7-deazaguanine synthase QueC [Candidatus Aminicenantia bacterium]
MKTNSAIILFSGGIDSTTCLFWAKGKFQKVYALTFNYGQRHSIEIEMAKKIADFLSIEQIILNVDLSQIGGSSLTDRKIELEDITLEELGEGIPSTYVPFRNGIFLSLAVALAEVLESENIVAGFHSLDSPNYPDTSKEFVEAMEKAINIGTKAGRTGKRISILSPLIGMRKEEIIKFGIDIGADYSYSISCYRGREVPCMACSACRIRDSAWRALGIEDHLIKRLRKEGKWHGF